MIGGEAETGQMMEKGVGQEGTRVAQKQETVEVGEGRKR